VWAVVASSVAPHILTSPASHHQPFSICLQAQHQQVFHYTQIELETKPGQHCFVEKGGGGGQAALPWEGGLSRLAMFQRVWKCGAAWGGCV
jgi:hypothetical protein